MDSSGRKLQGIRSLNSSGRKLQGIRAVNSSRRKLQGFMLWPVQIEIYKEFVL